MIASNSATVMLNGEGTGEEPRRGDVPKLVETPAPVNSVAVLLEASQRATPSESVPVVLADAGVANVNAQVDALIDTGVLRRLLVGGRHSRLLTHSPTTRRLAGCCEIEMRSMATRSAAESRAWASMR
jgi:hypothetical protein